MSEATKTELTPADLNRRLAELLGWRYHGADDWRTPAGAKVGAHRVPQFCTSLDAVAEARKALTDEERWPFLCLLGDALNATGHVLFAGYSAFELLDAPAETQARAILAVLEGRKP